MSVLMISLMITLLSAVQVLALDVNRQSFEHKFQVCTKGMWTVATIDEDPGVWHGNTLLEFQLPAAPMVAMKYEAILACESIVINGTGHQILRVKKDQKKTVQFRLHLPVPKDQEDTIHSGRDRNHTCMFELRDVSKFSGSHKKTSVITQCSLKVRTYLNRILPTCDYEKGKALIEEVEVSKEQGQAQIYLKHSANDVVTVDHDCHQHNLLGHNRSRTMEAEVFPLRPPGTHNTAMLVTFYPPCESLNETMREYYMHQRMDDCHLEIFSLCQDGLITISEMKIDFDDDAMLCHYPKPSYVEALESLELRFRIESMPIVGLLCLLIANGGLYLSITPFAISKCMRFTIKKLRSLEKKSAKSKVKNKELDPTPPASMEYDDVQISLFGKLSSDDLRQPIQGADSPIRETIVTQVEVHTELEVVDEQPRKELVLEDELHSKSKHKKSVKKRKASTEEHDNKKHKHSTSKKQRSKEKASKQNKPDNKDTPSPPPTPPPPPPLTSTRSPSKSPTKPKK